MKLSLNWIKDFVDIDPKLKPDEFSDLVTTRTAEVEGYDDLADSFKNIVVGKIKSIKPHPDADKLTVTETSVGSKTLQIICGASNIFEGMFAPVALPGSKVKWHGEGEPVELKPAKVRGVMSEGMLCAGDEIGLEPKENGIYDLTPLNVKEGIPLAKVFSKDDIVYEIDNKSLTHRPDLWSHYGMAREVAAITGKKLKPLKLDVKFPSKGDSPDIEIKDFDLCPRYCGVILENVKVEDSPQWLKDRLMAVGYRPISNIVDVTNYVMAELGQPLHAFDKNYIKKGIVVRRADKDEKITTLDGQKRKLDAQMLVIADHEKPVAIAGVMGGENSEINDNTSEIIIESANFDAASVRTTSTRLGLRTESVQRFEKSLDPVLAETAIKRTCELILKLCPDAKISGPVTDINKGLPKEQTVDLNVKTVSSKIGVELSAKECQDFLESLEFEVLKKSESVLKVTIPTFRATKDVDIEDDLVEEIVRMYGYENVPATLPDMPIKVPTKNIERTLKHKARQTLAYGLGMDEVSNYSFYGEDEIKKCLMEGKWEDSHVMLENYLSSDQTHLRVSLIPNLLRNVRDNLRFYPSFNIFEVGRTYLEEGKFFPVEDKWIAGAIVMNSKSKTNPFYEAKTIVQKFTERLIKSEVDIVKGGNNVPYAHPSKGGRIILDGNDIGGVFEVHPVVLKNWDIEAKVAMFELNFTKMAAMEEKLVKYKKLPKYPGLEIDVSVVIDGDKTVKEVEDAIKKSDQKLIEKVKLFDIYEGENVERGKKSLAFRVILQAEDRTLTDEEMAKIQKKIFGNLQKLGGNIRGT